MRHSRQWPLPDVADHNGPQWLDVRWEENDRGQGFLAGWYVVRVCPCHWNERVCLPRDTQAEAEHVRRVLLGLEPGQRGQREWAPDPPRPTAVLPGQVWRRNRLRNGRHFRVVRVAGERAEIVSVERGQVGWVDVGRRTRILLRRMLPPYLHSWSYTLIEGDGR